MRNLEPVTEIHKKEILRLWATQDEAPNTIAAELGLSTAQVLTVINSDEVKAQAITAELNVFDNSTTDLVRATGRDETHSQATKSVCGKKFDADKTQYHLTPIVALEKINRVLMHGADKYGEQNWRAVPNHESRYYNAAMRHMQAWLNNEKLDSESGLPHLAHAACCLMFLIEKAEAA